MANHLNDHDDCECGCRNQLNLEKLCVKKIKLKSLCSKKIDSKEGCFDERLDAAETYFTDIDCTGDICANNITAADISAKHGCFDSLDLSTSLCSPLLSAPNVCAGNVTTNSLSSSTVCSSNVNATLGTFQSLVSNEVCLPGSTRIADLLNCGKYRATTSYSVNTVYTLGSLVNFTAIIDDPNNNITLSPTTYTVPISGYYILTFKFNVTNLLPSNGLPILGAPIATPEILVNGSVDRESYSPWLSFNNQQRSVLTSLISLKAGDQITMRYNVLALDSSSGLSNVAGTVDVVGSGTENGNSVFKISLLNMDCTELPCAPSIPCTRNTCTPCTPQQGGSCRSCTPETKNDCLRCWDKDNCESCQ